MEYRYFDPDAELATYNLQPGQVIWPMQYGPVTVPGVRTWTSTFVNIANDVYVPAGAKPGQSAVHAVRLIDIGIRCGVKFTVVSESVVAFPEFLIDTPLGPKDIGGHGRLVMCRAEMEHPNGIDVSVVEETGVYSPIKHFLGIVKSSSGSPTGKGKTPFEQWNMQIELEARKLRTNARFCAVKRLLGWDGTVSNAQMKATGGLVWCVRWIANMADERVAELYLSRLSGGGSSNGRRAGMVLPAPEPARGSTARCECGKEIRGDDLDVAKSLVDDIGRLVCAECLANIMQNQVQEA